ncbi:TIGR00266 family protein [Clostridium isatidis]|uniref:TIGR00266 family protein n=1 Tax=Clostridium isatidis TaxID=182773 RepID=A0A343JFD9_9CLOT|nr:TIGR00266 family protein [Clostridium isatidis]ASW44247.1 TIGR00266 family protein [Clostridium isatidis]NLZ35525.1 TIGR00266 family protein [Clostridiales bacterium]
MIAHEIEYEIKGNEMQFVEITLDPREAVIAEAGAMMMMDSSIKMDTVFGDGSKKSGGFWGVLGGAAKRVITGESLFMTSFSNTGYIKQKVAFAAPYPGKIIPIDLKNYGGRIICQKDAYLCSAMGVNIGIVFTKKLGVGFFGGEGFILQKLEGDGMAFINAGGTIVKRSLMPGETIKIDTGCLVAMTQNVHYDIEFVGGIKNTLFGGEGMFFATLTGPGDVWIQSLPFSKLASRVIAAAPHTGGRQVDQGSILGTLGDIFER